MAEEEASASASTTDVSLAAGPPALPRRNQKFAERQHPLPEALPEEEKAADEERVLPLESAALLVSDAVCFDCEAPLDAPWVSVTYGTTLCLNCAGCHRSLGVHMSFVRSLTLDTLTEGEQRAMAQGGNTAFATFLADPLRAIPRHVWLALPLETRYFTPAADLYKRRLKAQREAPPSYTPRGEGLPADLDVAVKPPAPPRGQGGAPQAPKWTPDQEAPRCQLCKAEFNLFVWRHHCRMCGRCVCHDCSPPASWKPLPELFKGNAEPQRNCKLCVTPTRLMQGM